MRVLISGYSCAAEEMRCNAFNYFLPSRVKKIDMAAKKDSSSTASITATPHFSGGGAKHRVIHLRTERLDSLSNQRHPSL